MFCPKCGAGQQGELNFCKSCGANLQALRRIEEQGEKFDWSKTWVAEMFLSEAERKRRNEELERQRGITPEVKRYGEIKAGVLVTSAGLGAMIFLSVFMQGIILSGVNPREAEILSRIWIAGVIPLLVGLGLIFNGLFISRKIVELQKRARGQEPGELPKGSEQPSLKSADTSEFIPTGFSVTEGTTKHLTVPEQKR